MHWKSERNRLSVVRNSGKNCLQNRVIMYIYIFFFSFHFCINWKAYQRLIISDEVCLVRGVWCWKTRNSPMTQAKHIIDDTLQCPNVVRCIFKECKVFLKSIQPFLNSWQLFMWPWCNLVTNQREPHWACRNWEMWEWLFVLCYSHI